MRVDLWQCDRCGLRFVADKPPGKCPACNRNYTGDTVIRLAGRRVKIESVRLFGMNPLNKAGMTRGLDSLRLGCRCPHGWLISYLCRECSATEA